MNSLRIVSGKGSGALSRAAQAIDDPVARLKFLRSKQPSYGRRFLGHWAIWMSFVLAVPIPFLIGYAARKPAPVEIPAFPSPPMITPEQPPVSPVWLVEQTAESEVFSNGLRVDTRFTISNRLRSYTVFPRGAPLHPKGVRRIQPAGIVYHTTESCQAPFEAEETPELKRIGESVLEYVQRKRAYHYLIDRFGRVFRVVAESDSADHAGYSVWADRDWCYLNLNESFLGISFEAQTVSSGVAGGIANPAQVRSAAMLTEMLRSRYRIPAEDCVTHAQVSVNPSNMLVGYHTDWSSGFPFGALGLPDNYQQPAPAIWAFGFEGDTAWIAAGKGGVAIGARLAENELAREAAGLHLSAVNYRKALHERYRSWVAALHPVSGLTGQLTSRSAGR